jgi:WD40 repeat protein/serine/threonine protein kinase/tetratricopeptide (TPR) repeat protein
MSQSNVSATQWEPDRVQKLLDQAARLPEAERSAFLDRECAGEPELRAELQRRLQSPQGAEAASILPAADGATLFEHLSPADVARLGTSDPTKPNIPGHRVERVLGTGGMGIVYEATDEKLKRRVAIKMIKTGQSASGHSPRSVRRALDLFRREAESVAKLNHRNIVQIFSIGEQEEQPYFSMEFVANSLAKEVPTGTVDEPRRAAERIRILAEAMHYAHDQGVIHLDLKPENMLVAEDGTLKISDFGLAFRLNEQGTTGAAGGTPGYMAPEQRAGDATKLGPHTDVYAPGVVLLRLLTGKTPSSKDSVLDFQSLPSIVPGGASSEFLADLEAVIAKCVQPAIADRYASAALLAEDLRRCLANEPTMARPVTVVRRIKRWCQREPILAGLWAAFVVSLLAGLTFSIRFALGEREQRRIAFKNADLAGKKSIEAQDNAQKATRSAIEAQNSAEKAKQAAQAALAAQFEAEKERQAALHRTVFLDLEVADRLLREQDHLSAAIPLADALVASQTLQADSPKLATLAQKLGSSEPLPVLPDDRLLRLRLGLTQQLGPSLRQTFFAEGPIQYGEFSPDGKRVVLSLSSKGLARVWDVASGNAVSAQMRHPGPVFRAKFSPDGEHVVTVVRETPGRSVLHVWNAATGQPAGKPTPASGTVWDLRFTREGKRLVTGSAISNLLGGGSGEARLWEFPELKPIGKPIAHPDWIQDTAFSPDETQLLVGGLRSARVWNIESGEAASPAMQFGYPVAKIAFSPNGQMVAAASNYGVARVWKAADGEPVTPLLEHDNPRQIKNGPTGHAGLALAAVDFHPNGKLLLTACGDKTARMWNLESSGTAVGTPMRHSDHIVTARFSPDGRFVLSASLDQTAALWNVAGSEAATPQRVIFHHQGPLHHATFDAEGTQVLTVSEDSLAKVWSVPGGRSKFPSLPAGRFVQFQGLSEDGELLLSVVDQEATVWRVSDHQPVGPAWKVGHPVRQATFSEDRSRVALSTGVADDQHRVSVWSVATGQAIAEPVVPAAKVTQIELSRDGRLLAIVEGAPGLQPATLRVWDVAPQKFLGQPICSKTGIQHIALHPNGQWIATAGVTGADRVWNIATGQPVSPPLSTSFLYWARFSSDGNWLVTCDLDEAQVWHVDGWKKSGPPLKHTGSVRGADFSRDHSRLLTWSEDTTARLWKLDANADVWRLVESPLKHHREVQLARFSPDGRLVATSSADGTSRLWDGVTGAWLSPEIPRAGTYETQLAFSRDGGRLLMIDLGRLSELELAAVAGDPHPLRRLAELAAGQTYSSTGSLRPIERFETPKYVEAVVEVHPKMAAAAAWLGGRAADQEQWTEAVKWYQQAAEQSPEDAALWQELGSSLQSAKQYARAAEAFTQAIQRTGASTDFKTPRLWADRANVFLKLQRFEEALQDFDEATKRSPLTLGTVKFGRAFALASLERWASAGEAYDEFLKSGFTGFGDVPLGARFQRGLIFLARQDQAGYRQLCADLRQRFSSATDAETAYWLAWSHSVVPDVGKDFADAIKFADRAVELMPDNAVYRLTRGAVRYRLGEWDAARADFEQAQQLHAAATSKGQVSDLCEAYPWFWLAAVHHRLQRPEKARECWQTGLDVEKRLVEEPDAVKRQELLPWTRRFTLQLFRDEFGDTIKTAR